MDAERIDPIAEGVLVAERYRVGARIGRGGMGSVFTARHEVTGKRVALKVMSIDLSGDEKLVARFLREAKASATVQHPHAIEVLDVFHHEHAPVMVMELLEGMSLADHLETAAPLGPGELARVLVPVASALGHAHSLGIVHRDVKPDNVFLSQRDGVLWPKVLDFGIAKVIRETPGHDTMKLTSTGAMMGTPYYMAPEQAAGRTDLDHRADVWALGVLMYEAMTGHVPFRGENFGQVFAQILQEDPPPASSCADVPRSISDLIDRCLEKKVAKRLGSMREIVDVLTPFLDHVDPPLEARRASAADIVQRVSRPTSFAETAPQIPGARAASDAAALELAVTPSSNTAPMGSPSSAAPHVARSIESVEAPRRSRWPLAVGGVVVVALAVAAMLALSMGGPAPAPTSPDTTVADVVPPPPTVIATPVVDVAAPTGIEVPVEVEVEVPATSTTTAADPPRGRRVRPRSTETPETPTTEAPTMATPPPSTGSGLIETL